MEHWACLVAVIISIGWGFYQRLSAKQEQFRGNQWKDQAQFWMDAYSRQTNNNPVNTASCGNWHIYRHGFQDVSLN